MEMRNGSGRISRRVVLGRAVAAGAALLGGGASAGAGGRTVLERIINAPHRRAWDDQFDAEASRSAERVLSPVPILGRETVTHVEDAIAAYERIVDGGGWPVVPSSYRLELGNRHPTVARLRERLIVSGDLAPSAGLSRSFDTYVDGAVRRIQARHGLPATGVVDRFTYAALNVSASVRLGQLQINLARLRAMAGDPGRRYVVVNIPAARIEAVEDSRVVLRHTAVVGRTSRQTPILNSEIHEVILNPYWTPPRSIIEKDIVPLMRKDPTYLTRSAIRLFNAVGDEVAPETIDWNAEKAPELLFRQDPGRINAMASTKINFKNPHAVYMHDTPEQSLFGKLMRFESSGCVRVENVRDLSVWLLRETFGWDRRRMERTIASGVSTPVRLAEPVPVYFTYITAWSAADGVVQFREDIYRRDGVENPALQ